MTGENLRCADIVLIGITFIGVTMVTMGVDAQKKQNHLKEDIPLYAVIGAFMIPFLLSFGNIIMRKMKGMHENTVSLYMNPTLAILMYFCLIYMDLDLTIFWTQFQLYDWLLIIFFSVGTVLVQTLKFIALQNEEPGKLSHYQYMGSIYQLFFDVNLLGAQFQQIQWMGLTIMFFGYALKAWDIVKYQKEKEIKDAEKSDDYQKKVDDEG